MLTNSRFGFIATDCGTGHMWFCNAREYRINRWLCDSLATSGTECALLDGISLFASPNDTDCSVRYGFGFAVWEKQLEGQIMKTSAFVPMDTDARVLIISWDGGAEKVLRWSTDLILSGDDANAGRVRTVFSGDLFTCESPECPFPHAPFKICSNAEISSFTSNRALWLQGKADSQCDTGGFLGITFKGQSPIILVCGCDENEKLLELCRESVSGIALKNTAINWQTAVSGIKIKTPLPALDRLYNGWLPYQTLACRIMGRCSIYQSGGATGFRDQLQDAANLALLEPDYLKAQLIECCRHQYEQGDVMHWWHALEDGDKGVRTRCSDDLIWLPWALCEYVEKTGDSAFCETPVAFLASAPLGQEERDRYEKAVSSENTASVLVHAQQALDLALSRGSGEHALMKIGGGDWNDGMDKIGARGRGESVWLSWFFAHTAHRFSALLTALGNSSDAERYEKAAALQGKAANEAWDGKWFLRGYYDDGTKLGTAEAPCCQIDSIAQSFATLCPEADSARVKQALLSAFDRLLDRKNKLVRLFDPPFENARPSPGYIESYGPGFRENGGQYTHGAIWLVMALLKENCPDEALELIEVLLPEGHDMALYEAEPFVLAADVYSNPDCAGRAGWSWYTGSAGWMFRVISEELLGIRMRGGEITLRPRLPSAWKSCEISLRDKNGGEKTYLLADGRAKEIENASS